MTRANPFADLGSDFEPAARAKPVDARSLDRIAQETGFPSRQPAAVPAVETTRSRRRFTTGRNQQINVKATADTIARFYRLADERRCPLGELLEHALIALEQASGRGSERTDGQECETGRNSQEPFRVRESL